MAPTERSRYEGYLAVARTQLGEEAFTAAYREGQTLPLEQAIAEALAPVPPAPAPVTRPQAAAPLPSDRGATAPAPEQPPAALSQRERQIAALIAAGRTNREIAAELGISPRTADTHISHILSKLGFTSRTQIAAWAREQQLVPKESLAGHAPNN